MRLESEFPELSRLWRCGFERPANFDDLSGQALHEWRMVAELPEEVLKANAILRPAIHPAHPSLENIGHITAFHKRHRLKSPLIYLMATFGYLPLILKTMEASGPAFGHPWLHHSDARLVIDVLDRTHMCAFHCWRVSVLSDFVEDRKTRIIAAPNKRVPQEAFH